MTIYAIGDIHGQADMLRAAHDRIAADRAREGTGDATVIHLGDLTDRGPDSRGVLDILVEGAARGEPWVTIKGNHDRLFQGFLSSPGHHDPRLNVGLTWRNPRLGGLQTLASYGVDGSESRSPGDVHVDAVAAVPQAHRDFLDTMPLWHETREVLFVHAGIRPGVPLAEQDEEDLLWIRGGFADDDTVHPWLVVHGHTALDEPTHFGNRIDIDTGAGYGRALTAAVFEARRAWTLTPRGRVPLSPKDDAG